jgi:hypothetical protein
MRNLGLYIEYQLFQLMQIEIDRNNFKGFNPVYALAEKSKF